MIGDGPNSAQKSFLYPRLFEQLNPRSGLLQLGAQIPWDYVEEELGKYYSDQGRPAKPIRRMVGLCILKHLENLSDEVLIERWVENPYYQLFCGALEFQWKPPCDPSDLVYFRKRIGREGFELILSVSVAIHRKGGSGSVEKEVCTDTTVQEKNITFPTDDKLHKKVIERCWRLSKKHGVELRRSYRRELKTLLLNLRFRRHPKNKKKGLKASKRLKTIAGVLVRELQRKLPEDLLLKYSEEFELYDRVLSQKRSDKNKLYSLHEPHVYCMSKGKAHKRYEFGTKVSITKEKESGLVVGAQAYSENCYDGHTLPSVLSQVERITGSLPDVSLCDRGYRGKKKIGKIRILIPESGVKNESTAYSRMKQRKRFRKRAGIEAVIGHLKSDHRLDRNYLSGFLGDEINVLMAGAAFNFRKWLRAYYFCFKYIGLCLTAWLRYFVKPVVLAT